MLRFWGNILKILPSEIIPVLFGVFILKAIKVDSLPEFLVFGVLYVLIFSLSVWFLGMDNSEKDLIKKPAKRIFKKLLRKDVKN